MTRSRALIGPHMAPLVGGHEPVVQTGLTDRTESAPGQENSVFNARALLAFFAIAYVLSWAWVIPLAVTGHTVSRDGDGRAISLACLAPWWQRSL